MKCLRDGCCGNLLYLNLAGDKTPLQRCAAVRSVSRAALGPQKSLQTLKKKHGAQPTARPTSAACGPLTLKPN
eukprot:6210026-Pleurochrysis_carterae.AAC.4